jgi:hypothetical protein
MVDGADAGAEPQPRRRCQGHCGVEDDGIGREFAVPVEFLARTALVGHARIVGEFAG